MSENEKLQKLLRLKKYETPGEEYFDNLLDELKARQRRDALKQSAVALLAERVSEWYHDLGPAKWAVPAGSFAAVLVTFFALGGGGTEEQISQAKVPDQGAEKGKPETQVFELRLPKNDTMPMAVPQNGGSSLLPAGFSGFREL
jgi:hypothetical protein